MASRMSEMIESLKKAIGAQTKEWSQRPIKSLPTAVAPNPASTTTLSTVVLGDNDEFSVLAVHNIEHGSVDMVALYTDETVENLPLIGAVFSAWQSDGVTPARIPPELAIALAPELVTAFAKSVEPHLQFLKMVRIAELTMPDGLKHVIDQIDQGEITGVFLLPSDIDGDA